MIGKFYFTAHAIERYRQRYGIGLSYNQAFTKLVLMSQNARRLRRATAARNSCVLFEVGQNPPVQFVAQRRRKSSWVVVTVNRPNEPEEMMNDEQVVENYDWVTEWINNHQEEVGYFVGKHILLHKEDGILQSSEAMGDLTEAANRYPSDLVHIASIPKFTP